jgi:uncharacterized membrane protein (DUF2068 family)
MATTTEGPPLGISLLAILNIIVGIFGILSGITIDFIMSGGALTIVSSYQLGALVIAILQIVAGYGLWTLKSWAWWLAAFATLFGLVINVLIIFTDFSLWNTYLLPILIRIVILAYLLRASVKDRFR